MDHARKIGKPKSSSPWSYDHRPRRIQAPLACDGPLISEPPPQEDRRLANWRRWLADRERRQRLLCAKLKRRPTELALNAHERAREKTETRRMLQAAARREVTHQDRYRGNPAFWRTADRLKKCRSEDDENADDVVAYEDREARNLPPKVTRVALPDRIKREKKLVEPGASGSEINTKMRWDCGDYARKRASELKEELKFIEPKKPETDDLVVVGKKFQCGDARQKDFIRTPVISVTAEEPKRRILENPDERMALKIQDREFVLESGQHFEKLTAEETASLKELKEDTNEKKYVYAPLESDCVYRIIKKSKPIVWNLIFHSNGDERCKRTLCFENKGVRTVKLDWRNATPSFTPQPVYGDFSSCFFFNKNPFIIPPGQTVKLSIWFHSERARVYSETWKILVEPKVYPSTLRVRLWGTSDGNDLNQRESLQLKGLEECVSLKVRDSIIRDIVEYLFLAATSEPCVQDVPYELFFLEPDVFRARNPEHSYDFGLVDDLKAIYKIAKGDEDWNLCLADMRSALLRLEQSDVRDESLQRFREISTRLLRPNVLYDRPKFSRRKLVYRLLGTFFNAFETECEGLSRCFEPCNSEDNEDEDENEVDDKNKHRVGEKDVAVYREVCCVRIYALLCETVDKIADVMDLKDYLNKHTID